MRFLSFLRCVPLVLLLAVCPLIRGCGDNGYIETIGFPLPVASISRPSAHMVSCEDIPAERLRDGTTELPRCFLPGKRLPDAWYFLANDLVISEHAAARVSFNIAALILGSLIVFARYHRASSVLLSWPFQLSVLLFMLLYRFLTPLTFLPSLVVVLLFEWLAKRLPDDVVCDAASRLVFSCALCVIFLLIRCQLRQKPKATPPYRRDPR